MKMIRLFWDKVRVKFKNWRWYSTSQFGEDRQVVKFFVGKKNGFYVDVGAFHPRHFSNTRTLYENGWNGINIDISPIKIALFDFDRKRDINVCSAVGASESTMTAYIFGRRSALDTFDKQTALAWEKGFGKPYREEKIAVRPLNAILSEHGVEKIDYLNIDVEGFENAVLAGFDINKYAPECITIEIHGNLDAVISGSVYKRLLDAGYEMHAWLQPSVVMTKVREK